MSEYAEYADLWRQASRPPAEGEPDPDPVTGSEEAVQKLRALTHTRPDVGEGRHSRQTAVQAVGGKLCYRTHMSQK